MYKALTLLEYLIKNGAERVVADARDHVFEIKGLQHFQCEDDKGRDVGINVRNRSKEIIALLDDDRRIAEERKKARAARDKYTGVSSEGYRHGGQGEFDSSNSLNSSRYDDAFGDEYAALLRKSVLFVHVKKVVHLVTTSLLRRRRLARPRRLQRPPTRPTPRPPRHRPPLLLLPRSRPCTSVFARFFWRRLPLISFDLFSIVVKSSLMRPLLRRPISVTLRRRRRRRRSEATRRSVPLALTIRLAPPPPPPPRLPSLPITVFVGHNVLVCFLTCVNHS